MIVHAVMCEALVVVANAAIDGVVDNADEQSVEDKHPEKERYGACYKHPAMDTVIDIQVAQSISIDEQIYGEEPRSEIVLVAEINPLAAGERKEDI